MVVIPGTRRLDRLEENAKAAYIALSSEEVSEIDDKLDTIKTSDFFGSSWLNRSN
jgi:aryl-alcohol dehydrogenase-like predicted oxidoreductase